MFVNLSAFKTRGHVTREAFSRACTREANAVNVRACIGDRIRDENMVRHENPERPG